MSSPLPSGYKPGLFGSVALWVLAHRKLTGLIVAVLAIAAAVIGLPPRVDSDILTILPEELPVIEATKRLNDEEGGVAFLLLAFDTLDENAEPEVMRAYMDDLEERIRTIDGVEYAIHEVEADLALKLGLLNVDSEDIDQLSKRLKGALALGPAANPMGGQFGSPHVFFALTQRTKLRLLGILASHSVFC